MSDSLFWIVSFFMAILIIQQTSSFMLLHARFQPKNQYILNRYTAKLITPTENVVEKNYEKTIVNFYEDDKSQINVTPSDEYVHISASLDGNLQAQSNESFYLSQYNEEVNCSGLVSYNSEIIQNSSYLSNNSINSSTENFTNSTFYEDNTIDYSFNITDFVKTTINKWDNETNNLNDSNSTLENKSCYIRKEEAMNEKDNFLKTYDESYLNDTNKENLNGTSIGNNTENNPGFLTKEDLNKHDLEGKNQSYENKFEGNTTEEVKIIEYSTIRNDTEMEKELERMINLKDHIA